MAPEMISSANYSTAVDIYSFAVCVWQMVTRKIPYNKERYTALICLQVFQFID
jgi:serine/threonine protein kinase